MPAWVLEAQPVAVPKCCRGCNRVTATAAALLQNARPCCLETAVASIGAQDRDLPFDLANDGFRLNRIPFDAGWINQQQRDVIGYLQEENRVLREQLGPRRRRFTNDRRLYAEDRRLRTHCSGC